MYKRSEPSANRPDVYVTSRLMRVILVLVAICCLSIGAAVGAIAMRPKARSAAATHRASVRRTHAAPQAPGLPPRWDNINAI